MTILRRETFHQFNRLFLIGASILSVILPFVDLSVPRHWGITEQFQDIVYSTSLPELVVSTNTKTHVSWILVISIVYWSIVALLILRLVINIAKEFSKAQKPSFTENNAFSLFGIIKIDKKLPHFSTIKAHEKTHVSQMHFLDLLFFELLSIVFWINPIVFFYKKTIKLLHEFLADDSASQTLPSKVDYAELLMSKHFKVNQSMIVLQPFFNESTLKQRIKMLFQDQSPRFALWKYGITLPIAMLFVVFCSISCSETKLIEAKTPKESIVIDLSGALKNIRIIDDKSEIFTAVEENPEFPGGTKAMYDFLGNTIKYPFAAQRANVSGRVIVKFIVEDDGSIGDVEVMKGLGFGCDEEAIRAIKNMPNWKPGKQNGKNVRVYYNMPVVFKLD